MMVMTSRFRSMGEFDHAEAREVIRQAHNEELRRAREYAVAYQYEGFLQVARALEIRTMCQRLKAQAKLGPLSGELWLSLVEYKMRHHKGEIRGYLNRAKNYFDSARRYLELDEQYQQHMAGTIA